jgi:hypothetical protein
MGLLPYKDEEQRRRRAAWFRRSSGVFPVMYPNNWKGWLWYLLGWPMVIVWALVVHMFIGEPVVGLALVGAGLFIWIFVIWRNTMMW